MIKQIIIYINRYTYTYTYIYIYIYINNIYIYKLIDTISCIYIYNIYIVRRKRQKGSVGDAEARDCDRQAAAAGQLAAAAAAAGGGRGGNGGPKSKRVPKQKRGASWRSEPGALEAPSQPGRSLWF